MKTSKDAVTTQDLSRLKREIVHEFHIISEGLGSQVKQVAEGVSVTNEKLNRVREDLKKEIQETRQDLCSFDQKS